MPMTDEYDNEIKGLEKDAADTTLQYTDTLPRGYLSVSQITQYLKCGKAYEKRYIEDHVIPSNNFIVQGRGVHKAAEKLHLSMMHQPENLSVEEMTAVYSDSHDTEAEGAVLVDETDWGVVKDEGIMLTQLYRKGALGDITDPATGFPMAAVEPIAAERVVKVVLHPQDSDPIPFMGVIDLEEPTGIRDVKTKRKMASQADTDNSLQLTLYAHILGKPDVGFDQLVKPTKTKGARYIRSRSIRTNADAQHALDIAADVAASIAAGHFPRTNPENWWCGDKWCPYWDGCRGKKR